MEHHSSKRMLSTRQAQWKKQWISVFLHSGIDRNEAENAFNVYYGTQEINIFVDPIEEANGLTGMGIVISI